jgi:hypothetical protein
VTDFLGIKQYGYYYFDDDGTRIDRSTFAGIPRNSLSFKEVSDVFNGIELNKTIPLRFYKSFKDLSITIKNDIKVSRGLNF